jgi:hypothetical protein
VRGVREVGEICVDERGGVRLGEAGGGSGVDIRRVHAEGDVCTGRRRRVGGHVRLRWLDSCTLLCAPNPHCSRTTVLSQIDAPCPGPRTSLCHDRFSSPGPTSTSTRGSTSLCRAHRPRSRVRALTGHIPTRGPRRRRVPALRHPTAGGEVLLRASARFDEVIRPDACVRCASRV